MDDDDLFDELRRAADEHDPVPQRLVAAANAAYTFRTFEAELAELVFDSHSPHAAQLVRGPTGPRALSFRSPHAVLELEITREPGGLRLIGQLSPARTTEVEVRTQLDATAIAADELGRFTFELTPPRPFLLRFGDVTTEWINP